MEHPEASQDELAQHIINEMSLKAGAMGVITNVVPVALFLFAIDIVGVTSLQVELVYRLVAIYNHPLREPARRGEVLGAMGLSLGSSGLIKTSLSFLKILPFVGPLVGAVSDAALVYVIRLLTCQFYQAKYRVA